MSKLEASQDVLGNMPPRKAIVKLAIPATLALLAKAVYNIVDTDYIGSSRPWLTSRRKVCTAQRGRSLQREFHLLR